MVPDSHEMARVLNFVERHGYVLLFGWVLAEQGAIPVPSVPLLLAAGALIRSGRLNLVPALVCCVFGALLADSVWFALGRSRGRHVLRLVCRLSLEPDSCVRQTENTFSKYGMRSLLVSKFIPGLNAVAAPLAGNSKTPYLRFGMYDAAGTLIWSGAYLALGFLFSEQLETLVGYVSRTGSNLALLVALLFGTWIGWKWMQRRRFLKQLKVARITSAELHERINAGEELFIVDLRGGSGEEPELIRGAIRISPEELVERSKEVPRDREIILFCS